MWETDTSSVSGPLSLPEQDPYVIPEEEEQDLYIIPEDELGPHVI